MTDSRLIDARGPRFAAAVTAILLAVTLIVTPSVTAVVLLAIQALAFGAAAFLGMRYQPYGWFFRRVIAPRLGSAKELEDPAPPRFAQSVGLAFVVVALVGLSFNLTPVALIATGFALAAAFLNAAFKFCLGCEIYLLIQRVRFRRQRKQQAAAAAPAVDAESQFVDTDESPVVLDDAADAPQPVLDEAAADDDIEGDVIVFEAVEDDEVSGDDAEDAPDRATAERQPAEPRQ